MKTIYDFAVKDGKGNDIPLSNYQGKVLLVVNTATHCGLTPQYEDLQALYTKYQDQGFEILDFPCNQFKDQAPENDDEIHTMVCERYHTTFPRFHKIEVNGPNADPLFTWLKGELPKDKTDIKAKLFEAGVKALTPDNKPEDVKWNFGKFLINKEGKPISRYSPALTSKAFDSDIAKALAS
jgi:glutathione peroxidase